LDGRKLSWFAQSTTDLLWELVWLQTVGCSRLVVPLVSKQWRKRV
jgi:hypothetical protein